MRKVSPCENIARQMIHTHRLRHGLLRHQLTPWPTMRFSLLVPLLGALLFDTASSAVVSMAEPASTQGGLYEKRANPNTPRPPRPPPNSPNLITDTTPPPRPILLCVNCMAICQQYHTGMLTEAQRVDLCLSSHCRPQGTCRGNVGDAYKTEFAQDGGFAPPDILAYVQQVLFDS
ncbi:hypothetical protein F4779DRAFT_595570 [Xylariaceae sp. FL0662B]|nr:hypothetical protein F4779DRAFT_595570 [Xylariaceae sp. FL0662B]